MRWAGAARLGARMGLRRSGLRRKAVLVVAAVVGLAATGFAVTGCGISSEDRPVPIGSGLPAAPGNTTAVERPGPTGATSARELVERYLHAAVGGGEDAVDNLKRFMTPRLQGSWKPTSQQVVVVRLVDFPADLASGDVTPVKVVYQPVGVLTEDGSVEDLPDQPPTSTIFKVVPLDQNSSQIRIDTAPRALLISDEAFSDKSPSPYYLAQPIYFWDATNRVLVPDLRYLPLTLKVEQRPDQLVQWLLKGPSQWLRPAVTLLPNRTVLKTPVVNRDGVLVVNLSAQAVGDKVDELQRLVYQLQWSLRSGSVMPEIELQIEGQRQDLVTGSAAGDYAKYNLAATLPPAQRFYIKDRAVSLEGSGSDVSALLSSSANKGVVAAAIMANHNLGAFVHQAPDGTTSVRIVGKLDGKSVSRDIWLPAGAVTSRPVWLPGTKDQLLVVAGGRLYAVTSAGGRTDITPDQVSSVRMVSVAPDGRRIAMIADHRAYVCALAVDGGTIRVGIQRRPILPRQVPTPAAIAWESQDRVFVVGSAQGVGALWRVTADGVVAEDWSGSLRAAVPTDILAHPTEPGSSTRGEITIQTDHGTGRLVGRDFSVEARLPSPFYAG